MPPEGLFNLTGLCVAIMRCRHSEQYFAASDPDWSLMAFIAAVCEIYAAKTNAVRVFEFIGNPAVALFIATFHAILPPTQRTYG